MDVKQPAQVKKRESGEDDENEFASVEEEAFTMVSPRHFLNEGIYLRTKRKT